jgi:hypothetical protein
VSLSWERLLPLCAPASPLIVAFGLTASHLVVITLSLAPPWQVSSLSLWWRPSLRFGGGPCPLAVGLGLLAWALTPAAAGATPAINSAGKASQQRQEETEQEGERGQSPLQGDCSAQPRKRRGDRAAVRRPVRRHLLMAPLPDRRALERLCRHRGPNDRALRAQRRGHLRDSGEKEQRADSPILLLFQRLRR